MHEPYEEYEDDYDDNDYHENPQDPYQWYYKFDIGPDTPVSNWLIDVINKWWNGFADPTFESSKFPVNSWNPNTAKQTGFQYLGSNYQGSPIWKKKYFISDTIHSEYINHLKSYAVHFLQQPAYYNGLFDILN